MKVRKISMENIRSHVKTTVEFKDGFNCIVGGVGDGKSSILYALHFGLFGEKIGRSYDYLLREGQNTGKIAIEFDNLGKTYLMVRALRREKSDKISQDMDKLALYESGELIAGGKKVAVDEQLSAIIGIDEDAFKNIIWIQQERLKELLNIEPSKRQQTLDELFRLSDFLNAWAILRDFEKEYGWEKNSYDKEADIVGINDLRKDYDKIYEEFLNLQLEIENLKTELKKVEEGYKEAEESLRKLEDLRNKTEELQREESSIKAKIESTINEINRINEEIKKNQTRVVELNTLLSNIETEIKGNYEKLAELGLLKDQSIEVLRKLEKSLEDKKESIYAQQEGLKSKLQQHAETSAIIEKENKCPVCQQSISGDYRKGLLAHFEEERRKDGDALVKLRAELENATTQRQIIREVIVVLSDYLPRKDEITHSLHNDSKALEELNAQLTEKQQLHTQLNERLSAISKEISKFDTKQLEEAKLNRDKVYGYYSSLKTKLESGEKTVEERSKRVEDLKRRLDLAEEKIKRKERIEKLLKAIGDFRDAYKAVGPKLREEIVSGLTYYVQQVMDKMAAGTERQYTVEIDENYTPSLREAEHWRDVSLLSGGERTMLAFAYKIGLGQLIMGARGRTLDFLILDEPTESLGPEDGSIDRLADAISNLKNIEQIITVTHSEEFAEKAEHIIRVKKETGKSSVIYER